MRATALLQPSTSWLAEATKLWLWVSPLWKATPSSRSACSGAVKLLIGGALVTTAPPPPCSDLHACSDPGVTLVGFAWRHGDEGKMQETFGLGCAEFGSFSDLQVGWTLGRGSGNRAAVAAQRSSGRGGPSPAWRPDVSSTLDSCPLVPPYNMGPLSVPVGAFFGRRHVNHPQAQTNRRTLRFPLCFFSARLLQELAHDAGLGRGRGVAALAEMVLGVALSKSKKASRSNWSFWGGHPFLQAGGGSGMAVSCHGEAVGRSSSCWTERGRAAAALARQARPAPLAEGGSPAIGCRCHGHLGTRPPAVACKSLACGQAVRGRMRRCQPLHPPSLQPLQGSAPAQRPADQIRRHGRAGLVGGACAPAGAGPAAGASGRRGRGCGAGGGASGSCGRGRWRGRSGSTPQAQGQGQAAAARGGGSVERAGGKSCAAGGRALGPARAQAARLRRCAGAAGVGAAWRVLDPRQPPPTTAPTALCPAFLTGRDMPRVHRGGAPFL